MQFSLFVSPFLTGEFFQGKTISYSSLTFRIHESITRMLCSQVGATGSLLFPCGLHSFINQLFGSWDVFSPQQSCDKW